MRTPLFVSMCEACHQSVRNVHDRPEPHTCRDEQTRADDALAAPWKEARRG